ncbi:MAG: hypothetical protein ACJZ37_01510 [Candidatus Poseidoniales archaeon]
MRLGPVERMSPAFGLGLDLNLNSTPKSSASLARPLSLKKLGHPVPESNLCSDLGVSVDGPYKPESYRY